jgi:DNA-binding response OmpR family regulator
MAKILVVDDERVFCELLKTLLKSHGHEILTAYGGREALDVFKQHRPQFTLLDLRMPEMDGLEALKQLRAIDPKATVMILTAWGTDEMEQQARKLGAVDFLSKGLSLDTILTSLERVLKQSHQAIEQTAPPSRQTDAPAGMLRTDIILLVDEKPQTRDPFAQFLTQHGYHVLVAQDGPTALKLVEKERPQLVVLDMEIRGTQGVEMLRTLRKQNYAGGVILLTGSQDGKLLKEVVDLGSVDILGKPVDPERLMLAIQVGLILIRH